MRIRYYFHGKDAKNGVEKERLASRCSVHSLDI